MSNSLSVTVRVLNWVAMLMMAPFLMGQVSIMVGPTNVQLSASQTQQFKAFIGGTDDMRISWSLSPTLGTISASGVYTAPAFIPSSLTATLKATSLADRTKSATAQITLKPNVSVTVAPASVNLGASQSQQFTASISGSTQTGVTWSLSPQMGTVTPGGLYTAPATVSSAQNVVLTATSVADGSKTAGAMIRLVASSAPLVTDVSVTVGPASVNLSASQSQQFTASVTGSSQTGVTWSISPQMGTLTAGGLYTAPATIASAQNVVLTATSVADGSKTAGAMIRLAASTAPPAPAVSLTVAPASVNLGGSQSQQFTASVSGTSQTGVTWSISPQVGTISSGGLYTAPATIASAQNVVLTATSVADGSKTAGAMIQLTASPAPAPPAPVTVSFTSPGSGSQVQGTVAINASVGGTIANLQFYVDGAPAGAQLTAPPYTTNWNTTAVADGPHTLSAMAQDAGGTRTTASMTVTVKNTPDTTKVTLPVEVMGASGTIVVTQVDVPSLQSGAPKLWMEIHGLKYQTEASVQVNNGPWLPINDSTVTILGTGGKWGGIGGGFATLKVTMNLADGSVNSGANTVRFRFNATDGVTSGFRVLRFNILAPSGASMVSDASFNQDDPATWQAPLTSSGDIDAGKALWTNGDLKNAAGTPIRARCGSCHAQDGRDLKYFNYSNFAIRTRAMFHGLTAQQGDQIASYIRTLNVPAPASARPWNPPYQPGPGLDSKPVTEWAAGAGLNAVLDRDVDTLNYVMPNGSTANWGWNSYLNAREIPISLQLPDWNRWLPTTHPLDAFGDNFGNSSLNSQYLRLRSNLRWHDATVYKYMKNQNQFALTDEDFLIPLTLPESDPMWKDPSYVSKIYSVRLWETVKFWEIYQEFGLEDLAPTVFGAKSAQRAWYTNKLFFTSPFMTKIPRPSKGIGNGSVDSHIYLSFIWYHVQLLLNDGNGIAAGTWPIDWPYSLGYPVQDLTWTNSGPRAGTAGILSLWLVKALQAGNSQSPRDLVAFPALISTWIEASAAQRLRVMNEYTRVWQERNEQSTPYNRNASDVAFALPQLRYQGVDLSLLNRVSAWAQTMWPTYAWNSLLNAGCSIINDYGEIKCQ